MSLKECVNPKTESRIELLKNDNYKITIFCCKSKKSFVYYMKKFNPEITDLIIDCLYNYCETGEIKFKMPKLLPKTYTKEYISKFIIQALNNEKSNSSFSRNVLEKNIKMEK